MKDEKSGYGEIKFRAQHGEGLTFDKVRSGSRTIELRLRDKRHAKLEEILIEHGLLETANELERGYQALTAGMGYTVMDVNKIRGSNSGAADHVAILISDYLAWPEKCKSKHLIPKWCFAVIVEGHSLNQQDESSRFRKGTAKKNMLDCLKVFHNMRRG